jgi:hypothetical protein
VRARVAAKNPGLTPAEVTKLIRERWRQLDAVTKAPYIGRARAAKAAATEGERPATAAGDGEKRPEKRAAPSEDTDGAKSGVSGHEATHAGSGGAGAKRAKSELVAPKRPPRAFALFARERRKEVQAEHPDLENVEVSKRVQEAWDAASADVKRPFEADAAAAASRFEEKMAQYCTAKAAAENFVGSTGGASASSVADTAHSKALGTTTAATAAAHASSEIGGDDDNDDDDGDDGASNGRTSSQPLITAKPKKVKNPETPFALFSRKMRKEDKAEIETLSPTEATKLLKERWGALDAQGRAPYVGHALRVPTPTQRAAIAYCSSVLLLFLISTCAPRQSTHHHQQHSITMSTTSTTHHAPRPSLHSPQPP